MQNSPKQVKTKKALLSVLLLFLSACASSSFFVSYPSQMAPIQSQILQGKPDESFQKLSKKGKGPNHILDVLESARIAQIAGDYESSKKQFEEAFYLFEDQDSKAKLDLSDGGSLLGSFALNDNALPYKPEAYERILAHQYQSFNYLAEGNLSGSLVEVRRAAQEQEIALEAHHKELVKAEEEANNKGFEPDIGNYEDQLGESLNTAAKVKNSFQNAYTFYYSAIIREASGEKDGAFIDIKKAFELYPDNPYLQQDFWRLGKALNMHSDLEKFGPTIDAKNKKASEGDAELIVFFEQEFIPAKQEVSLPFAGIDKFYTFAFPAYLNPWRPGNQVDVSLNERYLGRSAAIGDIHALAAKALEEGSFKRLLRQMIRLSTKTRLQNEALQQNDAGIAQLFSNAYSLISERADLRSWLTLPDKVQVARFKIPSGSHKIQISNATFLESLNIDAKPGQKVMIKLNRPGNSRVYMEQFYF